MRNCKFWSNFINSQIKHKDVQVSNPNKLANFVNVYFSSIAKQLQEKIEDIHVSPPQHQPQHPNSMVLFPTSEAEVAHVICQLKNNKSTGLEIPVCVIKECVDAIKGPIANIINE